MWKLEQVPDHDPVKNTQWIQIEGKLGRNYHIQISMDNVHIPVSIRAKMASVPKFDMINEWIRYKYLLTYLKKTGQKVKILKTLGDRECINRDIKSGLWKDVFDL